MKDIGLVEAVGIVIVLALIGWPIVFLQVVRPRVMARIGRWLQVGVRESTDAWDAGTYDAHDGAPLHKTLAVTVADLVVILVGIVGVIAAISIPLFLFVETGLPYRWEGQLTGTAVRIVEVVVPPMTDDTTTARVTVRNEARAAMQACRLDVAGYTARNGYLTGASNAFDLEPEASVTVDLKLDVSRRIPGTHAVRLNLECGMRLKDSVRTSVEVRQ